jgi:glycosyltransferase involved in cell wall biosynthesis
VLKVIGDGPLASRVVSAAERRHDIQWLGKRPTAEILPIVGKAKCLILPSLCYENFPRAIVEAFSKGTPVVASRLGAMAELVNAGRTGLHFEPGDAADLASRVRQLLVDTPTRMRMRREARREYEQKYTAAHNYENLMGVYRRALEAASRGPGQDRLVAGVGDVGKNKGFASPTERIGCLPANSETG